MGLVAWEHVGFLFLLVVELSLEQWLQQGQDPITFQQQPPVSAHQQAQNPLGFQQQPPVSAPQQAQNPLGFQKQPPASAPQQAQNPLGFQKQPPASAPQQAQNPLGFQKQPPASAPQQAQNPLRFHQQPPVLTHQQALQNPQGAGVFQPQKPGIALGMLDPASTQSKQLMQAPVAPLTWQFPHMQEEPQQPAVPFQLQVPSPPDSVAAQCAENFVHVEVKKDFYGNGHLAEPSSFSLGDCAAVGEDPNSHVLIFQYELHKCGSSLTMTADELVYTFTLLYTPGALVGTPIVRADAAAVAIHCHYPRLQNVSSDVLMPAAVPFAATIVSEEVLVFSLKLMTDDWMFERPVNQYFLGQFMNVEASVKQYNHVPLRVFIDGCVATAVPDVNSVPRYSFIENHGCLVDAKLTGSPSHFMHRVLNDKLQFQLEAFKFQQAGNSSVYITCALKAVLASTPTNSESKACSFTNGWTSADESDDVCMCCDSICGSTRKGRAISDSGLVSEGEVTIGPIVISD
ncbi:zona pellucida sperm-binding protein 3-like [Paramisgurnus dabryanus]|uniref:zona pellucida sperm-binding protein 3-like n=1 Tax=Paramisgurnus dabryanus TaxID=90735 RepID=UPI0031F46907